MRTMRTITTLALALALALGLAACSDDSDTADPISAAIDEATGTPTLGPCSELAGKPTDDVIANPCEGDGGSVTILMTAAYDCADGRKLHWNDQGYGYAGATWNAHARPDGQLIPPDADTDACLATP